MSDAWNAGDTFLPPIYNHLYAIISDPEQDADSIVLVNFTTYDADEEDCCIVNAGEHPFFKHKSCVRYKDARVTSVELLTAAVQQGAMNQKDPLSEELLQRTRQGAARSVFIPEECRKILEDQNLI